MGLANRWLKNIATLLFALILCVNTLSTLAISSYGLENDAVTLDLLTEPGTETTWETEHVSETDIWNWRNLAWEFGPYPSYTIYLANGTEVTNANFIPAGENFTVVIRVQKDIFSGNETLGGAQLRWHMNVVNVTNPQDQLGWASVQMGYLNYLLGEEAKYLPYDWVNGSFHVWSELYNRTLQELPEPEVHFKAPPENLVAITQSLTLTATNLWDSTTPSQSIPGENSTTYKPAVRVGDWANYAMKVFIEPYDPSIPYEGLQNGTIHVEVLDVVGSNVTYTLTFNDDPYQSKVEWMDVATGQSPPDIGIKSIVAANLSAGDPIYLGFDGVISQSLVRSSLGTERIINMYETVDVSHAWDRSTGILYSANWTDIFEHGDPGPDPGPGPDPRPPQSSIYLWDQANSYVNETDKEWWIHIAGQFNASLTPMGPYYVDLEVYNSHRDRIDFGYVAWESNRSPNRMVAVGRPGLTYGGYQETWAFQKLDMQNQTVYSVTRGAPWIMRVEVTSPNLANVTIGLRLQDNVRSFVNVTNWYTRTVEEIGGWQYDPATDTYFWNSSVVITRTEEVYGPHLEERWLWTPHNRQVNVTDSYWNETSGSMILVNRTEEIWGENLYLIYDHVGENFSIMQGYTYWTYDSSVGYHREVQVLYPLNVSDPTTNFFTLNLDQCRVFQSEPGLWTVDFIGTFNDTTYVDTPDGVYWIEQPIVYRTDGQQIWADWEAVNWNDFNVAVDRILATTTFFKDGKEVKGWFLQTDPGETFILQSQLQGATLLDDIDAFGIQMHAGEGRWESTENYWSDVEVRLIYNMHDGTFSSVTYNRTERSLYLNGTYWGWQPVNVTGYHYLYNVSTSTWNWENETYTEWNWTQLTGYHWEYWNLNQTAYAIDPQSPSIWIDRSQNWIPWDDPAFQVPESYATLLEANISVTEDRLVTNLNITFTSGASDTRYWWEVFYGNLTFGIDYSQGWGEHTLTEWSKTNVYYVNSSGTGGEKWYAEPPSQPYYTLLNGTRYPVMGNPYIVLGTDLSSGSQEYLKTRIVYQPWSDTDQTEYLFREPWDPQTQKEPRYYELLNGTRVYIEQGYRVTIRQIRFDVVDAYSFNATGQKTYLENGTILSTFMPHAETDWERGYFNETLYGGIWVVPHYYELINGSRIYRDEPFENMYWNETTGRYDLSETQYSENATSLEVKYGGYCVTLNDTIVITLRESSAWWQPDPSGMGYYIVTTNGTRIFHTNPWNVPDSERVVTFNGKTYRISWPNEYYTGYYNGDEIIAKRDRGYVNEHYTTFYGDEKYEMPYPGAFATSWWDLETLNSQGGKILSGKSVIIEGTTYPILRNGTHYYIDYGGSRLPVTNPTRDTLNYYSLINGNTFWNITQTGWIVPYGQYDSRTDQLQEAAGTFLSTTGYNEDTLQWNEWNKYGEDPENRTRYLVNMTDGTRVDIYTGRYVTVWPVTISGVTYYTFDEYDRSEMVNEDGQQVWKQFIRTMNGTKIYFDWGMNPPTWGDEVKIDLQGMNYTRLVPYEWEVRNYKDRTYLYNITITNNTDIYFENGTIVPHDANFKVWGTNIGPGVRIWTSWDGTESWIEGLPSIGEGPNRMYYLETIEGNRIYGNRSTPYPAFGYDFHTQTYPANWTQWGLNVDQTTGNHSLSVIDGEHYFQLYNNVTDVFTRHHTSMSWWGIEYYPSCYIVLTNGTRWDFEDAGPGYIGQEYYHVRYNIQIKGQQFYVVGGDRLDRYYTVTEGGTTYTLYDDRYLIVTPYNVPVIADTTYPVLWMNATSDKVLTNSSLSLYDLGHFYLVNYTDGEMMQPDLVSRWWPYSETVRRTVFQHQEDLRDIYPRYNITMLGIDYFLLDPAPTKGWWWGDYDENSRYDTTFTFMDANYTLDWNSWDQNTWRRYDAIIVDGRRYDIADQSTWKAVYSVTINGVPSTISLSKDNIYRQHTTWGPAYTWILENMNVHTVKTVSDIILGTPQYDMWGVRSFTVVPETGALDLDGDLETVADQFFVRRTNTGADEWNQTVDRMQVSIWWDPNVTIAGDEIHVTSWMGNVHTSWTFTWNETYIWYHADNMSTVSETVLADINSTLLNSVTGEPNPGYWEIARMAMNITWEDLQARAKKEGWNWIDDNTHEWEWIWFGTHQDYRTGFASGDTMTSAGIGFTYEYGGLLLYNDTNSDMAMQQEETTHFFMPEEVGSITFVSPGEAYGNFNNTGTIKMNLTDRIDYGVTFTGVNGTLFPYNPSQPTDMWGWWDGNVYGADFQVPDFNTRPTTSSLDLISFYVHFNASVSNGNATNNEANLKIDERYGDWYVDPSVIDGRQKTLEGNFSTYLRGMEVLEGRSLAASWYINAYTDVAWVVHDAEGEQLSTEDVAISDIFEVASNDAKFATIYMGGAYDWQKPTGVNDTIRTFNVTSYTTPLGTFKESYVSDSGRSSTGYEITESMYFLTVGFSNWNGYGVYHDPQTSTYISKTSYAPSPPAPTQQPSTVSCLLSTETIANGESVIISGSITPTISNAPVTIQISEDGTTWIDLALVTSDSEGQYVYNWTPTTAGTYQLRARWEGNFDYSDATSNVRTLTVQASIPTPFPTSPSMFYAIAAAVAIAFATGAFVLFRRKPPL